MKRSNPGRQHLIASMAHPAHTVMSVWDTFQTALGYASCQCISNRTADQVGENVVFNINGNEYRLIANVNYGYKQVLVKFIGTHADCNRLTRKDIENL